MKRKKSGHLRIRKGTTVLVFMPDGTKFVDKFVKPTRKHEVVLEERGRVRAARIAPYKPGLHRRHA